MRLNQKNYRKYLEKIKQPKDWKSGKRFIPETFGNAAFDKSSIEKKMQAECSATYKRNNQFPLPTREQ